MKRNEIVHKMHDEIKNINLAIEQMQKIYNSNPDAFPEAEYAIHLLNLAKKDIQATLNHFDAEADDKFVDTFAI